MKSHLKISLIVTLAICISLGITSLITDSINKSGLSSNNLTLESISSSEDAKALKMIAQQCFTCHSPDTGGGKESRLGPPMHKVREHYYKEGIKKEDFIKDVVTFIQNPNEEKSKMKGAIRNFGLMPNIYVDQDDAKLIAAYIFENDLSSEEWKKQWEAFKTKNN